MQEISNKMDHISKDARIMWVCNYENLTENKRKLPIKLPNIFDKKQDCSHSINNVLGPPNLKLYDG